MAKIITINGAKAVELNDQTLNIKQYNELYHNKKHLNLKLLDQLYNEIFGCVGTGCRAEYEKSKQVNQNLFADVENSYNKYLQSLGQGYEKIWTIADGDSKDDDDTKIQKIINRSEQLFDGVKELVKDMQQLKSQRDATGNEYNEQPYHDPKPDQTRDERNKEADQLTLAKMNAIAEISRALTTEPRLNTQELENPGWQKNISHAISVGEVAEIKTKTLTDIKTKQDAKQKPGDKRKRDDDHDNNKENKKPKLDTNELIRLIQEARSKNTYEELEPILKKIETYEGEKTYQDNKEQIKQLKNKILTLNNKDYKVQVVQRVKGRMDKLTDKTGLKKVVLINKLEQLKSTNDTGEITRLEEEINQELGQTEADIILDKLINELRALVKQGKKVSELNDKLHEIKDFAGNTNVYRKNAYQKQKSVVDALVNESKQLEQTPDKGIAPWKIIVPISLLGGLLITGAIIIRSRRNNKKVEWTTPT